MLIKQFLGSEVFLNRADVQYLEYVHNLVFSNIELFEFRNRYDRNIAMKGSVGDFKAFYMFV